MSAEVLVTGSIPDVTSSTFFALQDMGDFVKSSINKGVNTIKNLFRLTTNEPFSMVLC